MLGIEPVLAVVADDGPRTTDADDANVQRTSTCLELGVGFGREVPGSRGLIASGRPLGPRFAGSDLNFESVSHFLLPRSVSGQDFSNSYRASCWPLAPTQALGTY